MLSFTKTSLSKLNRRVPKLVKLAARSWFAVSRGDYWHFAAIYCETVQHCNRRCSYCPQSIAPLPRGSMSADDFDEVMRRLAEHNWAGPVYLNRFGEPLLDSSLAYRIGRLKQLGCDPQLFSNGDLLTLDLAGQLVKAGLSVCKLTRHEPYREGWDECIAEVMSKYPGRFIILDPVIPDTIGGLNAEAPSWSRCELPSWAFIINPDLRVSLCCHDYARDAVFGDLHDSSIANVWNNPHFAMTRKDLRKGVFIRDICKACAGDKDAQKTLRGRLTKGPQ